MRLLYTMLCATLAVPDAPVEQPVRFPAMQSIVEGESLIAVAPSKSETENAALLVVPINTPANLNRFEVPGTSMISDMRGHPLVWEFVDGKLHYISVVIAKVGRPRQAYGRRIAISPAELRKLEEDLKRGSSRRPTGAVRYDNVLSTASPLDSRLHTEEMKTLGPAYYGQVVDAEGQDKLLIMSDEGLKIHMLKAEWELVRTIPTALRGPFQVIQNKDVTCLLDEHGKVFQLTDDTLNEIGAIAEWKSVAKSPSLGQLVIVREGAAIRVVVVGDDSVRTLPFVPKTAERADIFMSDELSEKLKKALQTLSPYARDNHLTN